jgi:hypothetical protein
MTCTGTYDERIEVLRYLKYALVGCASSLDGGGGWGGCCCAAAGGDSRSLLSHHSRRASAYRTTQAFGCEV